MGQAAVDEDRGLLFLPGSEHYPSLPEDAGHLIVETVRYAIPKKLGHSQRFSHQNYYHKYFLAGDVSV